MLCGDLKLPFWPTSLVFMSRVKHKFALSGCLSVEAWGLIPFRRRMASGRARAADHLKPEAEMNRSEELHSSKGVVFVCFLLNHNMMERDLKISHGHTIRKGNFLGLGHRPLSLTPFPHTLSSLTWSQALMPPMVTQSHALPSAIQEKACRWCVQLG